MNNTVVLIPGCIQNIDAGQVFEPNTANDDHEKKNPVTIEKGSIEFSSAAKMPTLN
jgi:hypothetical protein